VPLSSFSTMFDRSERLLTYPLPRTTNSNSESSTVRPPTSMLLPRTASRTFASGMSSDLNRFGSTMMLYCLTKPPTLATSATPSALEIPYRMVQSWIDRRSASDLSLDCSAY